MRDALAEVIDPDLGVNIVDLGFVRGVAVEGSGSALAAARRVCRVCRRFRWQR